MIGIVAWVYLGLAVLIVLAGSVIAMASVRHGSPGDAHKSILMKAVAAHALGLPIAGLAYRGQFTLSCAQQGLYGVFQFAVYPLLFALIGYAIWKIFKHFVFGSR
jgi:NO-binding membrane sensor protein with MHYT domain